ncbi:nucleotidyltransferase family protein [Mucilaginibacter sp.]|uniref:nucleotidyltransferase family protein n=1 Tax=Mucilaginibacter sp. TaxID=1882438 RepID=UPI00283DA727|nr:nucleotidyltransferase family protein [Mucilaginibacter sp.]MDR3696327.1 nucleotidyltransferase family protein [Mucilaginibacter sp.]
MEVIVLAGGMGTRLRTVVNDLPKPMAPVNGKPFIEYLFQWLSLYPVSRIILSVGYKSETISEYFGDNFRNIPIEYIVEPKPLGTGGAIKLALNNTVEASVVIINGDTYFPIDLDRFLAFHVLNKSKLSIALKKMEKFDRYGSVELIDQNIIRFNEKQFCEEGLINGGIYLVNAPYIRSIPFPEIFSFEKEVLEKQTNNGNLKGMVFGDPFIDIGIPEDYFKAAEIV